MKKVINGRRYDTTTAQEVANWDNGFNSGEFEWESETLYLKKTGEFFLHCQGGPYSSYAGSSGNSFGWGEKIELVTVEQAKKWAEKAVDADRFEEIFGAIEEEANRKQFSFLLPESLHEALKQKAEAEGLTMKDIAVKALKEYLK
ncbi:hypothetical protein QP246_02575 [Aerococcus urinae]|uniref:hypothetical protein n=2 Tax=Bacillota TaxID=1239 RepID=UPI00255059F1|nr:hypothetical protein [Aerococcus urinae]MDK6688343.1 hypothetical protein [Aerococcus urinae]